MLQFYKRKFNLTFGVVCSYFRSIIAEFLCVTVAEVKACKPYFDGNVE